MEKLIEMAPNVARRFVFLLIQTLRTFWATRIFIFIFDMFGFEIPRFPGPQKSGLGLDLDLRVRPAAAPAAGNLVILKSWNFALQELRSKNKVFERLGTS